MAKQEEVLEEEEMPVEEVVDTMDESLRPDHRFFSARTLLEKGKFPKKLNRRLKFEGKLRIVRMENGSLAEITGELLRKAPKGGVVPGTVIMLVSAKHDRIG